MWKLLKKGDPKAKYVRYAAVLKIEDGKSWRHWVPLSLTGVVTIARIERDAKRLSVSDRRLASDCFKWLNDNIPCPPFLENKKAGRWSPECICWWRLSAKEAIGKLKPLMTMLRRYGFVIRTLYTDRLNNIKYKDKYQVVAEWKEI